MSHLLGIMRMFQTFLCNVNRHDTKSFSTMFYSDPVTFYTTVMGYRTMEYAQKANWVLLQPAELLFSQIKSYIFSGDKGILNITYFRKFHDIFYISCFLLEFNPEFCSKWETLLELLKVEIPAQMRQAKSKENTILILCSDYRTCHQLNEVNESMSLLNQFMPTKNFLDTTKKLKD